MPKTIYIVPHSHYDAAWLQTYEGYLQLNHRHILEVLKALRQDPDFKFVFDQVALLEPFLERYPEQREFFRQMVKEGRIEITGGMYVMPDVNLPGGESLIRQAQMGKAFYERELGVDVQVGYLLDVFGNHPQMPQLMRGLGFESYIFGRVRPADSPAEFYWEGLDGTKILAHWMPFHYVLFWPVPGNEAEFQAFVEDRVAHLLPHATSDRLLMFNGMDFVPPQPHVVPLAKKFNERNKDLQLRIATPSEYLKTLQEVNLETVTGDFNAVFQGCYTSRIRLKQENRRLEMGLETADRWNAVASVLPPHPPRMQGGARGGDVEAHTAAMEQAWRKVLFNQFHDVICGCHANEVYREAMDGYADASAIVEARCREALSFLAGQVNTEASHSAVSLVVFNDLTWPRTDVVRARITVTEPGVFDLHVRNAAGQVIPRQLEGVERYGDGGLKQAEVLFVAEDVPALGYEVYQVRPGPAEAPPTALAWTGDVRYGIQHDPHQATLENEFYRLTLDNWTGAITSLWDKRLAWEVIDPARPWGNTLTKEPDHGDLWEINGPCKGGATVPTQRPFPFPQPWEADFSHRYGGNGMAVPGSVCVQHRVASPFGRSQRENIVRLYHRIPRIEFETRLTNQEEWVRYRVAFPTTLREGQIVHEIPFGAIPRPEGEFPAQNWVDYSDGERGVALLNQGLPGHNVTDGVLLLSVLRAVMLRGQDTDGGFEKGVPHVFRYALVPHAGGFREARLYRAGLEFNHPLRVRKVAPSRSSGGHKAPPLPARHSFLSVAPDNILVSAFKPTAQGLILRVYEAAGEKSTSAAVTLPWRLKGVRETDLLERPKRGGRIYRENGGFRFHLKAFQIRSFLVEVEP